MEKNEMIFGIRAVIEAVEAGKEIDKILEERRANLKPREPKYKKGVLKIYSEHAVSPMKGGYME